LYRLATSRTCDCYRRPAVSGREDVVASRLFSICFATYTQILLPPRRYTPAAPDTLPAIRATFAYTLPPFHLHLLKFCRLALYSVKHKRAGGVARGACIQFAHLPHPLPLPAARTVWITTPRRQRYAAEQPPLLRPKSFFIAPLQPGGGVLRACCDVVGHCSGFAPHSSSQVWRPAELHLAKSSSRAPILGDISRYPQRRYTHSGVQQQHFVTGAAAAAYGAGTW